ncbi:MAG: AsnC family transcriptional regulator [Desulfovibrio sp.]|jgi:DNA-binding Lrp family transcriptional regulator|nr:AsnC family transcriptional regulator [Desulfovibrio sp.]
MTASPAKPALDAADRRILDLIQTGFPIVPRPYALIGEKCGLAEEEALRRVRRLKEIGIIRRLGANFRSDKLGFRSTLCAASVPEEKLADFITRVNAEPGVTHNYLRRHKYNVWFTLIGPSREEMSALLERIGHETGVAILDLPARAIYKIKVDFNMEAGEER